MKKIVLMIAFMACACFMVTFWAFRMDTPSPDSAQINLAIHSAMESGSEREAVRIQTEFLTRTLEEMSMARRDLDNVVEIIVYLIIVVFALGSVFLYQYYKRRISIPFRKLQNFAAHIAVGNLDIPLEMDKDNIFGAFTESFDLMREELRTAKENEYRANQSKKELLASLSHDIKTPVASIKSSMELLIVKTSNENEKEMYYSINAKLEQIDDLVTNIFHATLEELQVLKVAPTEILSTEIPALIRNADNKGKLKPFSIPGCVVLADSLRLQQVFDNIVSNSYKYADTEISVSAVIDDDYLIIDVKDYGPGVLAEELPLLTGKFYRGKNTEQSKGYGLGLYISRFFMEQMSGGIDCENCGDGFAIRLLLKLA